MAVDDVAVVEQQRRLADGRARAAARAKKRTEEEKRVRAEEAKRRGRGIVEGELRHQAVDEIAIGVLAAVVAAATAAVAGEVLTNMLHGRATLPHQRAGELLDEDQLLADEVAQIRAAREARATARETTATVRETTADTSPGAVVAKPQELKSASPARRNMHTARTARAEQRIYDVARAAQASSPAARGSGESGGGGLLDWVVALGAGPQHVGASRSSKFDEDPSQIFGV